MDRTKPAICSVCGETDETLFYKGQKSICKEHHKEKVRSNRAKNIDRYREFDRNRANNPERIALRKAYQKTIAFKVSHAKAVNKYNAANAEMKAARSAVNHGLRDGKIDRLPCIVCGTEKTEAHHPDYSRPLDVIWLCPSHHKITHSLGRAILDGNTKKISTLIFK